METPLPIGTSEAEILLDKPESLTDTIIVFLPGISGGAFSERFKSIIDAGLAAGFAVARVNAWKDAAAVEQKTLREIYQAVDEVVIHLQQQGYKKIYGIGKSFGGAVMLTQPSDDIRKKVLWAPAIGVSDTGSNISESLDIKLGGFDRLTDLTVDRAFLQQHDAPTLLIHGTADQTIPFSNSEKIVSLMAHAELLPIIGADHSYNDKNHEQKVIEATIRFLTDTSKE